MSDPTATKEFDRLAEQVAAGEDFANVYGRPNYLEEMAQAEAWRNGGYGPQYASSGVGYAPVRSADYGMLPPVHQSTPYATMAYQIGGTPWGGMSVRNLVGEPSPFPHVLRGYSEDFTRVMPYLGMMGMLYPWTYYGMPPMPPMPRGGGYGGGGGTARASASAGAPAGKTQPPTKPAGVDLQPILDLVNGIVPQTPAVDLGPNASWGELNPVPRKAEEIQYPWMQYPNLRDMVPPEAAQDNPVPLEPVFGADMHTMNDVVSPAVEPESQKPSLMDIAAAGALFPVINYAMQLSDLQKAGRAIAKNPPVPVPLRWPR